MKSWFVHYKNKYEDGEVLVSENEINVFDANRKLRVVIRKNGADMWTCVSKEYGLQDCHDLAPIPKQSRVWKLFKDHTVGLDELADERRELRSLLVIDGRVPSEQEIKDLFKKEKGREPKGDEFEKILETGFKKQSPKQLPPADADREIPAGEQVRDVEEMPVLASNKKQKASRGSVA